MEITQIAPHLYCNHKRHRLNTSSSLGWMTSIVTGNSYNIDLNVFNNETIGTKDLLQAQKSSDLENTDTHVVLLEPTVGFLLLTVAWVMANLKALMFL